jgi:hypothetical protein
MTNPGIDPTLGGPQDLPPMDSEEAAEVVRQDEAMQKAGRDPQSPDDVPSRPPDEDAIANDRP